MAYANGTGGWCGCNCNCCPPQPLYSEVTVAFCVGTPFDNWTGPSPDTGCVCGPVTPLRAKNLPKLQAMPAFGQEDFLGSEDGLFVFALACGGCIPSETVTVTLTTTGLGFWISGGVIYMVGSGTCTAAIIPATKTGCGTLTPTINGTPYTYVGSDGDSVAVDITIGDSTWCCQACQQGFTGTSMMAMKMGDILQRQKQIRRSAALANRAALREKIRKTTSLRSKPTSEPPQTSQ